MQKYGSAAPRIGTVRGKASSSSRGIIRSAMRSSSKKDDKRQASPARRRGY